PGPRTPRPPCCSTTSTCPPATSRSSRAFSRPGSGWTPSVCRATCTRDGGAETTLVSGELMPPHVEDLNDHVVGPGGWPSTPEREDRQAEELEQHSRTVLSHPSVALVTYWGLGDRGAWLHAPSGLVR